MRTPVELRNDAWECLQRAEQASARREKAILLILAQGWASLADEMERLAPARDGDAAPIVPGHNGAPLEPPPTN
jgi:hypothetical protein